MNRKKIITIRVTDGERDSYQAIAKANGKTLGEYIRYLLEREIIHANYAKDDGHE